MALTTEGNRLTAAHQEAQIRLAGLAAALTVENGKTLDATNLDGTAPRWLARQTAILETMRAESVKLARAYIVAFRAAEGVDPDPITLPELPTPAEVLGWVVPTIKARSRDAAVRRQGGQG